MTGDTVTFVPAETVLGPLELLRETPDLLVLNKPAGLATVSLAGQSGDSMAARVRARDPSLEWPGPALESGIVHRLDAATSGVLLVARTDALWAELRRQTRERLWEKTYLCLIEGRLDDPQEVALPIGQHRKSRRRMTGVIDPEKAARYNAQPATSRIEPMVSDGSRTLLRVRTQMGLRHQVRVHLASIHLPVVNDGLYGHVSDPSLPGHYLHGESICWEDPSTGEPVVDQAPLPAWWPRWALDSQSTVA